MTKTTETTTTETVYELTDDQIHAANVLTSRMMDLDKYAARHHSAGARALLKEMMDDLRAERDAILTGSVVI